MTTIGSKATTELFRISGSRPISPMQTVPSSWFLTRKALGTSGRTTATSAPHLQTTLSKSAANVQDPARRASGSDHEAEAGGWLPNRRNSRKSKGHKDYLYPQTMASSGNVQDYNADFWQRGVPPPVNKASSAANV
eukprot:gnl/MRDRNA2_/MRDRNA2_601465_c0_seq1.p1 gnl/MRDRNA2_/MRDRNA2_601465_c0~~gnl/MRDRNA2_/MRDRNA2_601465_c0_seq1.p1  ORF type:complete len:136 (+),score=16.86 gnl/MRDRNA2_/MRDRNA2_601465_c0_seq1:56-463(+)